MKIRTQTPILTLAACIALLTTRTLVAQNAYVTSTGVNVSVFDTTTDTLTATIPVGRTLGVAVTPDGSKVYVTDFNNGNVVVIATATNTVVATIPSGTRDFVAITPDGSKVYATNFTSNHVSVISTATNTVTANITVGSQPSNLVVTPDGSKVYVACRGGDSVSIIDTATDTVTGTVSVGDRPVAAAVTPDGSKVYVPNFGDGTVSVIATATNTVTSTIPLGLPHTVTPLGLGITPDGSKVYVSGHDLLVIDTATDTVTASIPAQGQGVAVTPDGSKVYLTNASFTGGRLTVIDTATGTITKIINGNFPEYVAMQARSAFSTFSAKLNLAPALFGSFDLKATFQLASGWSINPVTQPVTFSVGSYNVTIPAGSFHQLKNGSKSGAWVFSGVIDGVSLSLQIDPLAGNAYEFKVTGAPVNLTGVTSPTTVSISINGSYGTTVAKF